MKKVILTEARTISASDVGPGDLIGFKSFHSYDYFVLTTIDEDLYGFIPINTPSSGAIYIGITMEMSMKHAMTHCITLYKFETMLELIDFFAEN